MKTLTFAALALMTIGLVVGVIVVTNPQLSQRSTEAEVPDELTLVDNEDVTVEFTRLAPHNRWDYMLTGVLCFTDNPPYNGRWSIGVWHDGLEGSTMIGGSVERITSVPTASRCNGAPHRTFSAPINLPDEERLPEGVDCLPEGDVSVTVETAGPPWNIQHEVATIDRSYFCGDDLTPQPTQDPNATPTPAPLVDVTVNLDMSGTWKDGFNKLNATVLMCNFEGNGTDVDWETCAVGNNKQSDTDTTSKGTNATLSKSATLTIDDTGSGKKAMVLLYDYVKDNNKADNSGIFVEPFDNTTCNPAYIDFGAYVCGTDIPAAGGTKKFKLKLPNPTATTYELIMGKDAGGYSNFIEKCSHAIDSNNKDESHAQAQCNSSMTDNKIKVTYHNQGTTTEKLNWILGRCNGTIDDNEGVCEINSAIETDELVQNYFESENTVDVPAGQVIMCTFDKSKYPSTENQANVRSSGAIACEVARPTSSPTPSAGPSPTVRPSRTPTPSPTPASGAGAGYYTSISFYNGSSKSVTSITTITCYGKDNGECNSELVNTSIAPNQRGVVETNLILPENVNSYSVKCRVTFDGSSTPVNCPNEVVTPLRQNVLYRIVASGGGAVEGLGVTEIQACDVNKDQCCNANDYSVVATKYADEVAPTDQNLSDINGDGIINGFDLVYTQVNFGKGTGCVLNLAPELEIEK